jgi:hypothetical protein
VPDSESRGQISAAWGVVAVVLGAAAVAAWMAVVPHDSKFPAWPAWVLASLTAVAICLCFASLSRRWPYGHRVKDAVCQAPVADNAGQQISGSPGSFQAGPGARIKTGDVFVINPPPIPTGRDEPREHPKA